MEYKVMEMDGNFGILLVYMLSIFICTINDICELYFIRGII